MKLLIILVFSINFLSFYSQAQLCDPTLAPTGLTSTYTPGSGALLEWNVVPGSFDVMLRVDLPAGGFVAKRIRGFEVDQFLIPDVVLNAGVHTWRVQAACSTTFPYSPTPISLPQSFTVVTGIPCPATVSDVDGNVYDVIDIVGQCWMEENLKVEHYNNGDAIPTGLSDAVWAATHLDSTGAFAVYNNLAFHKVIYGLLYNHYAVKDPRGLCPTGWSAGTDTEWTDLRAYLGGVDEAGARAKAIGTLSAGTGYWQDPNTGATNSSGFTALPGGLRSNLGNYAYKGYRAHFWSTNETGRYREVYHDAEDMRVERASRVTGMSVRCVKD